MGKAKRYLGMKINQASENITLNQDQYVKNIVSRFEKSFKHQFKTKDSPLPRNFVPSKKDCPITETQTNILGVIHYRALLHLIGYIK